MITRVFLVLRDFVAYVKDFLLIISQINLNMLEQFIISLQIILIDIVMAADNAIIIGMIASGFADQNRRKIIAWGIAAAFIFRIVFAFGVDIMLNYPWIKLVGGLLLLWIVNNLRTDFFGKDNKKKSPTRTEILFFHRAFIVKKLRLMLLSSTMSS